MENLLIGNDFVLFMFLGFGPSIIILKAPLLAITIHLGNH